MFAEEILIKLGLDKKSLTSGLKEAKQNVSDFANNTKDSLKDVKAGLKDIKLAMIGFMVIDKVDDWIKKTKEVADFWGTFSTGGMKAIQIEASANGLLEKRNQLLSQLRKENSSREEGQKNVDKENREDQLKILDQPDKVSFLRTEDNANSKKLTQLKMEQSSLEFEISERRKKGRDTLVQDISLSKVLMEIQKAELAVIKSQNELKKEDIKLSEQRDEISKRIADRNAKLAKENLESVKRTVEASHDAEKARKALAEAKQDRTQLSLDDLANMDPRQYRGDARDDIFDAREVQRLEADAKDIGLSDEERKYDSDRALEMRKGIKNLRSTEKDPLNTLEAHAKSTAETLKKFENEGIPIKDD